MRKIRQLTTELTFRCNARCPACHRIKPLRINLNDQKYTISLENFKQLFNPELLQNLEWLLLNGNFGDSVMNKEFRDMIKYQSLLIVDLDKFIKDLSILVNKVTIINENLTINPDRKHLLIQF